VSNTPVSPLRVIVPMKSLDQAKSRLWANVPKLECQSVTMLMLDIVLRASVAALGPTAVRVVGGDVLIQRLVMEAGAAYSDGCAAALFMPGDLPMLESNDIAAIAIASKKNTQPVGVRANPDGGTNAMLIPATCAFGPRLGEDSFAKHAEAALQVGSTLVALDLPRVAFDMDSFEDFIWARENIAGFAQKLYDWQAWLRDCSEPKGN
jgi:2-phospho-L-lactate guanylyltransferase (CobY/MobA/RfbA family)